MAATGARVYAFEPNPYAHEVLSRRFGSVENVCCINKGVLDRNDRLRLYLHENANEDQVCWSVGSSLLSSKGNVNPNEFVEVEVVDFAEFVRSLNRDVKLVKLDVEGVECRILNRLMDTGLIRRIGFLLVETHEKKNPSLAEETERLRRRIAEAHLTNIDLSWT